MTPESSRWVEPVPRPTCPRTPTARATTTRLRTPAGGAISVGPQRIISGFEEVSDDRRVVSDPGIARATVDWVRIGTDDGRFEIQLKGAGLGHDRRFARIRLRL